MSTSSILTAVLNKQHQLNESMGVYPAQGLIPQDFIDRQASFSDVPVKAVSATWENINTSEYNALFRAYEFQTFNHLMYFVNEILREAERANHHPILKIDHRVIEVTLYTRDFNDVTESDLNLAKIIDEVFEDITYIEEL